MQLRILTNKDMKKVKLLLAMFLAVVTVSGRAQETVGGLVCGQTYDYDYIISVLGEPDYVSHDMYEVLVYKEKRPSTKASPVGPPTGTAQEAPKEDSFGFAPGVDGWCYTAYYISTDRYSFSHPALPGIEVRVGDQIEKVRRFPGTVREYKSDQVLYWSSEEVDPDDVMWSMYPRFYYNENGVIEEIAYYYD
jgi:hypothetical protein